MIWYGKGRLELEREHNEPYMRSCWECNSSHEHLRESAYFHWCFACGKQWCLGWDFDQEASDEKFDVHFSSRGLKPGDSTTKVASAANKIVIIEI